MNRMTRSRRAAPINEGADTKTNAKRNVEKITKTKSSKGKTSINNVKEQNENIAPITRNMKSTNVKSTQQSSRVLQSKVQSSKDKAVQKNKVLITLKSPALRDRTNTSTDIIKKDHVTKKLNKKQSKDKIEVENSMIEKAVKKNVNITNEVKITLERCKIGTKVNPKNNLKKATKETAKDILPDISDSDKNIDNYKEPEVQLEQEFKSVEEPIKVNNKKVHRKMNMSMEDVEKLLNEDNEDSENEIFNSDVEENEVKTSEDKNPQFFGQTNVPEENKPQNVHKINKFFKYKNVEREIKPIKPITKSKRNVQKPVNSYKKVVKKVQNDSIFSPKIKEQKKSRKQEDKNLRPRMLRNYCEESKRISSVSEENERDIKNNAVEKNLKGVPIYRAIGLSQAEKDNNEEIYAFPDDSQESKVMTKKRKKTVKKAIVSKRAKKSAPILSKKTIKNIPRTVQFQDQIKNNNMNKVVIIENNEKPVENNTNINKSTTKMPNVKECTFEESSTIRIISDKTLEENSKINLMATPMMPKTITSELKLFGPKNPITSKPTTQYSNMVNHSLIRKSMSPITKVMEAFDAGSPWRPVDAFSRIQRVVQSTPQVNRLPLIRERRAALTGKKSISTEDTIHISTNGDKQKSFDGTPEICIPTKKNELSPRKFGTVLSNLSPIKSSIHLKSPLQAGLLKTCLSKSKSQSPIQAASPQKASPKIPINEEEMSTIHLSQNQNNEDLHKSPIKKGNTPSPFRFEKIRSKRSSPTTPLKTQPVASELVNKQVDFQAGSLKQNKPKMALKQTNLNNFLNIDDMPESVCITTAHGIFNDVHSTPVNAKKYIKKISEDLNVHNAFGFDDEDLSDLSPVKESPPIIAAEDDIKNNKKGKLFPKAKVKSALPTRISQNTVKNALTRGIIKKNLGENIVPYISSNIQKENRRKENEKINNNVANDYVPDPKKAVLEAASFSDTFDVLSETEKIESNVLEDVHLFVDLQPEKFTQPPRRSYSKRKRAVHYDRSMEEFSDDEELHEKKKIKKKEPKLSKEERKRMEEWIENTNKTFEEIDVFDLVVE